jgi:hypothetical protein
MAKTSEEMAKRFEEQAQVQKMQHDMLQAQQESINDLKKMIALLIEKPRKKKKSKSLGSPVKPNSSSKHDASSSNPPKNKGNGKEGELATPENTGGEDDLEHLEPSSEEEENSEHEADPHTKRMEELENQLEAIAHRSDLQEV